MARKLSQPDPIASSARKAAARRRLGVDANCACGESRVEALIRKADHIACAACIRQVQGKTIMDKHHVAGKANSPVTVSVPVNDHRAQLSIDQYDWPKPTRENPHGSPLVAAAACIRGFVDTIIYLLEKVLSWIAGMLETLDALLTERWGVEWWANTEIQKFTTAGRTNAK